MQGADNIDFHRHQLVDALSQCAQQMRNTAAMLDGYVSFFQGALPMQNMQNMFSMFTPPQTGIHHPGVVPHPQAPSNGVPPPIPPAVQAPAHGRKRRDAEPEAEGSTKRRRRRAPGEKKERDPNMPKRPPSAYLLFQNEVREEMKKAFPNAPYVEVLNKIAERWSKMSDEEKKIYTDATSELRAKFETDKAAYDASLLNGAHAAPGSTTTPAAPAAAPAAQPPAPVVVVPPAPVVAPAPAPAVDSDSDSDVSSDASSAKAVTKAVVPAAEEDSDSESEESSSEEEHLPPKPSPAPKKAEKPVHKKETAPPAKEKKERKKDKKDKKSRKENKA